MKYALGDLCILEIADAQIRQWLISNPMNARNSEGSLVVIGPPSGDILSGHPWPIVVGARNGR